MSSLFENYRLIKDSGLFDEDYYCATYPDVRERNVDPLLHYLESDALEPRNPNRSFDARQYVRACHERGEHVDNPLVHYIESSSAGNGWKSLAQIDVDAEGHPQPGKLPALAESSELLLSLDRIVVEPNGSKTRLMGQGWCLATSPIAELSIALGSLNTRARFGLSRADVGRRFPGRLKADHSGFEFVLTPIAELPKGVVQITFTARLASNATSQCTASIDLSTILAAPRPANPEFDFGREERIFKQPPMQLYVDSITAADGVLHVAGWALCLAPIVSVQIYVDDEKLAAADYGRPREDVAAAHPEYPNALHSGFALHMAVGSIGVGDRNIKVQATASTGISRETVFPFAFPDGSAAASLATHDNGVQCYFDVLELTTGGSFVVNGWAVGAAATENLSVFLDNQEIGQAETGIERPDVGNLFPRLAHARRAGFAFRHRLSKISDGEHLAVLRHLAGGRETEILLPVQTVPGNEQDALPAGPATSPARELLLSIDLPRLVAGAVPTAIRGSLELVGWALARKGNASIEIAIDGQRIKTVSTGIRRPDVQRAFPDWDGAVTAGFSALLPHRALPRGQHTVCITLCDGAGKKNSTEFRIEVGEAPETEGPWALRRRMTAAERDLRLLPVSDAMAKPLFTITLKLNEDRKDLQQARITLMSIQRQEYEHWRLNIIVPARLRDVQHTLLYGLEELGGRVELLSAKLALARMGSSINTAHYAMVLRAGDELSCDALLEFAAEAARNPGDDFFYCDDRRLNPSSGTVEPFFKPQWSPELLFSMNYIGRAWCVRAAAWRRAAIRPFDLSSDYHLVLRLTEKTETVRHIPATLLETSSSFAEKASTEHKALRAALARRRIPAIITADRVKNTFRVRRKARADGLVSIIIPTCAARGLIRTCIDTLRKLTACRHFEIVCIENIPAEQHEWKNWLRTNADTVIETTEAFNWSRFNNLAVRASRGRFLLFLNDDVEIIDPSWLDVLLEEAERSEIGVVGPQLLYPDHRVQHAGMFLAELGTARHAFRYAAEDDPGYFGLALTQRDVIAVTGACLMTRREIFDALSGFDESHAVVNNDLDYCLRIWQRGLRTIYTPHTRLIHHELASRSDIADRYDAFAFESKWRNAFVAGDPFFNPRLSRNRDDYSIEWEPAEIHCAGHPVFQRDSIRRILAVKLDHIGDCVTALPAIRRLKHHFPKSKVTILTGHISKAIWKLEPAVDEIIEFDFFHVRSALGLVEHTEDDLCKLHDRLKAYRFDLAIDLRKHWETRPVLRYTGARYLAGFDIAGKFPWLDVAIECSEDTALLPKRLHTADDLVNLVDAISSATATDRKIINRTPDGPPAETFIGVRLARRIFQKRVVCVHPAVGNEMRQWPLEYFSALIDQLIESEEIHVVLIGGPGDAELGEQILGKIANKTSVWSLIGKIPLECIAALLARSSLFVGNNSGPQHIAGGLGVPTVGIHSGVVDAREWGPIGPRAVAIQRAMGCGPCYHARPIDCSRGMACLRGLMPTDVVRVCRRLLALPKVRLGEQKLRRYKVVAAAMSKC